VPEKRPLVIVESPAKAKTIAGFLGNDYVVESSIGHIRDLPRNAADVPEAYKKTAWARLGVDVENDFKPLYIVSPEKRDQVRKLKALLKDASELYLATDEDREGESIAWHLREVLSPPDSMPVKRMVFHEITRPAIERAVDECRDINQHLVDAQEVRRILDRLYGYEVSPVLWKKVMPKLSAGRVQSVACRILVERERARMRFRTAGYWDLEGTFERDGQSFGATLVALDGKRLATGKDFDESGALTKDVVLLDEGAARSLAARLDGRPYDVRSVEEKPFRRSPYAPFMTSTLQQEAGRKLRFSSQRTMQVAQRLYENGYITYMRTDSTTLSETALTAARQQARELYGAAYVPDQPRQYVKKVKNAQEAHEAIRPAGDTFRTPDDVARELSGDELRLYDLVWKRTVASQMADATGQSLQVRLGTRTDNEDAEFAASGKVITFPGFMRAYVEGADDPEAELEDREVRLPALATGENVACQGVEPKAHATQPPARYTEASLVKALEELGVGRPSTYASIIGTIQDRGYVWKKGTALVPSFTAFAVVGLLEQHFGRLVDYRFTASMEDDLDGIATGSEDPVAWLRVFYEGDGDAAGLHRLVSEHLGEIDAREVNSIPIGQDANGVELVVRVGRYGPYLQRGEDRASVPEDLPPDELTPEKAEELLSAPSGDRVLGTDPASGAEVVAKAGRYGPYVMSGERTASLFKTMSLDTVELDTALRLLTLPRVLGNDPADGEEIVANNGRYGPYVKKGSDYRNIESEESLFTVTLDEALAIFAQPKQRRGQREAAPPLKELGNDPVSGKPMVVKEGRFGPYVTDGETNASLRKDDAIESLTDERAAELLADRRARGPVKKRTARKAPAKKAAAKKPAKKAVAKKKPA
jgi:DNA topoisomerase-1